MWGTERISFGLSSSSQIVRGALFFSFFCLYNLTVISSHNTTNQIITFMAVFTHSINMKLFQQCYNQTAKADFINRFCSHMTSTINVFKCTGRLFTKQNQQKKTRGKKGSDSSCPRCGLEPADLSHMLWGCPRLKSFWLDIFKTFSSIIKIWTLIPWLPFTYQLIR